MLSNTDAKLIHALKSRRGREKHGLFLAEGIRVVEDLLSAGIDLEMAVVATTLGDNPRTAALRSALENTAPLHVVDAHVLARVTDTETPQGVLVVARVPDRSLADVKLDRHAILLVLDAVQDPGNLGTLIRSADAFGAAAVIALPGTTDFWSPKVIRSTAGAAFRRPLISAGDVELWEWLAQRDVASYGADMHGQPIGSLPITAAAALIVGNEGSGLRAETRARITQLVSIPMRGHTESLNVSVAAGILLYELSRRLGHQR